MTPITLTLSHLACERRQTTCQRKSLASSTTILLCIDAAVSNVTTVDVVGLQSIHMCYQGDVGSVVPLTGRIHTTGNANQEIGINPLMNSPPMRLLEVVLPVGF